MLLTKCITLEKYRQRSGIGETKNMIQVHCLQSLSISPEIEEISFTFEVTLRANAYHLIEVSFGRTCSCQ